MVAPYPGQVPKVSSSKSALLRYVGGRLALGALNMEQGRKLRVYIDIDGTILYDPPYGRGLDHLDLQLIGDGLEEFLEFAVEHCEPYWLSYRTHLGNLQPLEERLFPHLPPIARSIPAAYWDTWKSEAIDEAIPFVWFEDGLERECEAWLRDRGLESSYFEVDRSCRENPRLMLAHLRERLGGG